MQPRFNTEFFEIGFSSLLDKKADFMENLTDKKH